MKAFINRLKRAAREGLRENFEEEHSADREIDLKQSKKIYWIK